MHFRYDRFIKRVLRKLFSTMGQVSAEVEVAVDAQRIDILFSPALPRGRPPPFDLGGTTAERAARELAALPRDAWERRQIAPFMVTLQKRIAKAHLGGHLTEEEKELLVTGQKMIDAIEDRGWKRGKKEGLKQGIEKGIEKGIELMVHLFTRKLDRPLTDRERETLLRRLDTLGPGRLGDVVLDLDAPALAAWLAAPRAR